jgi:hypothetical protein
MPAKEHMRESVAASNRGPHPSTSAETQFLPMSKDEETLDVEFLHALESGHPDHGPSLSRG